MRTIDIKSLMIGALAALSIIALTSSIPNEESTIQFVASPNGTGIFNHQTKTLYLYQMRMGDLKDKPYQTFKVAEDGSSVTEIKEK